MSEDIWMYINNTLMPTLERTLLNHVKEKTAENGFLLIGIVRVRQIRVEECK